MNAVSFVRTGESASAADDCSLSRTAMNERPIPLRRIWTTKYTARANTSRQTK